MTLTPKLERRKHSSPLKFEKNNTPPLLLILVTEYPNFLEDSFYQGLTMVSKRAFS